MAVTRRREKDRLPYYERERDADRRYNDRRYSERIDPRHAVPPVVIVTPGSQATQQLPYTALSPSQTAYSQPHPQRQFRVMGYEDADA
jgi:hypothetical protein